MAKPGLEEFVAAKIAAGHVSEDDVITLRRYIYGDMAVSLAEGAALFKLNNAGLDYAGTWYELFPEAVGDILVHQARPEGYVSQESADWLIGQITADGRICTRTELDAVLHVLEKGPGGAGEPRAVRPKGRCKVSHLRNGRYPVGQRTETRRHCRW
ncbi:hypothetical protein QW131_13130 [Roseibium salinum]|nr:hypothetical protein [Roseibium salinum]